MAFKILCFVALLSLANAGYESSLGYAHSYATPLAYTAGHYGGAHLSTYSAPVISKTLSAAPLAYSSPLAHYYSASLGHYHTPSVHSSPIVTKTVVSAPVIHKTVVSTPVIKSYAPSLHSYSTPLYSGHHDHLYSSHFSAPLVSKSYSLGYSSYPSYGYASKYHF